MPLGGVGTMTVTNPTITTLTVNWDPADGNVQGYKVIYVPVDGGLEIVVSIFHFCSLLCCIRLLGFERKSYIA